MQRQKQKLLHGNLLNFPGVLLGKNRTVKPVVGLVSGYCRFNGNIMKITGEF